jgi:hypothetical protein
MTDNVIDMGEGHYLFGTFSAGARKRRRRLDCD